MPLIQYYDESELALRMLQFNITIHVLVQFHHQKVNVRVVPHIAERLKN